MTTSTIFKNNVLEELITSKVQYNSDELQKLGVQIGKLYTNHGLPIDMALSSLNHTKMQKLSILDGVCQWFIEHKRNSGATEKAIERQRNTNRKMVEDFLRTGETEIY